MPAYPYLFQLLGIAAFPHDLLGIIQRVALRLAIGALLACWTKLAASVSAIHLEEQPAQLLPLRLVGWSGYREGDLQKRKLARCVVRELLQAIEAERFFRVPGGCGSEIVIGVSGDLLGIQSDEVFLDPAGTLQLQAQIEKVTLSIADELVCIRWCRR